MSQQMDKNMSRRCVNFFFEAYGGLSPVFLVDTTVSTTATSQNPPDRETQIFRDLAVQIQIEIVVKLGL